MTDDDTSDKARHQSPGDQCDSQREEGWRRSRRGRVTSSERLFDHRMRTEANGNNPEEARRQREYRLLSHAVAFGPTDERLLVSVKELPKGRITKKTRRKEIV